MAEARPSKSVYNNEATAENIEKEHISEYSAPYTSCIELKHEGKEYAVRLIKPEDWDSPVNTKRGRKAAINSKNPIYDFSSLAGSAPDGVYVWIEGDRGFFAIRVNSIFEFGTKHKQLAFNTGTRTIFLAGECELKTEAGGRSVDGNLLSGTYTKKITEEMDDTEREAYLTKAIDLVTAAFKSYFGGSVIFKNTKKTLITETKTPLSVDELTFYKALGYKVLLFNSKQECMDYQTALFRIGHLETMSGRRELTEAEKKEIGDKKAMLEKAIQFGGKRQTRKRRRLSRRRY
jgi:hypothetical protein